MGKESGIEEQARSVLGRYPAWLIGDTPEALGNRGGFSGARLWRWGRGGATFGLRAWPVEMSVVRLAFVHELMREARGAGLTYVPALVPAQPGTTWVEHGGRLWEVLEWLPGQADFRERPSRPRLEAACVALARLHRIWERRRRHQPGPYPAILRRLRQQEEWQHWRPGGKRASADDPASAILERARRVLPQWLTRLPDWLDAGDGPREPVQPCLCDPWHDHLLFDGDRLTGIVDYGAAKVDHPAVDVARLLGSLIEDDDEGWRVGLEAYRSVRPFSDHAAQLARRLDRSGTVLGVANWVRWLSGERPGLEDRGAAARRLATLVTRSERWT
jgi:homoserine kinase type II